VEAVRTEKSQRGVAKILTGMGLGCLLLLISDQVVLYTVLADDVFLSRRVAPFDPPLFTDAQRLTLYDVQKSLEAGTLPKLARRFDPDLGWCNPRDGGFGEFAYDWAGCRKAVEPLPRMKAVGIRRVVTLGCSMTHGEEVGALETWPAQLDASRADIEVANLGVAAYGIDQAFLRYRRDGAVLEPDEVWLGLLPLAALRTTTMFRPLALHWATATFFKPRFSVGPENDIFKLDNPAQSFEDVARLLTNQTKFLAAVGGKDLWVDRAPIAYSQKGSHWSHFSSIGRLAASFHEGQGRELAKHYEPTSETYRVMRAIVRAAHDEIEAQGVRFRLLVLPGPDDLDAELVYGRRYWQELVDDLSSQGVRVFDLSETLVAASLTRAEMFAPMGHYSPATNRLIAKSLSALLGQ
jgi:hypothetical protein